jgi:hypothetical protein
MLTKFFIFLSGWQKENFIVRIFILGDRFFLCSFRFCKFDLLKLITVIDHFFKTIQKSKDV